MNLRRIGLLAVTTAVVAAGVIGAQLVSAHSRPVLFDPPPGTVLDTAPERVTGWFTSELRNDPNWTYLHVIDEDGERVDNDQIDLSTDRHQMSVGLQPDLGPGRYIVEWRTFDDEDGEIFGDCVVFYIGQEAADKAIEEGFRLDAGSRCTRIEYNARSGTPVPGSVGGPTLDDSRLPDAPAGGDGESGGDGLPLWVLIAGIGAGMAVGLVGGRVLAGGR